MTIMIGSSSSTTPYNRTMLRCEYLRISFACHWLLVVDGQRPTSMQRFSRSLLEQWRAPSILTAHGRSRPFDILSSAR